MPHAYAAARKVWVDGLQLHHGDPAPNAPDIPDFRKWHDAGYFMLVPDDEEYRRRADELDTKREEAKMAERQALARALSQRDRDMIDRGLAPEHFTGGSLAPTPDGMLREPIAGAVLQEMVRASGDEIGPPGPTRDLGPAARAAPDARVPTVLAELESKQAAFAEGGAYERRHGKEVEEAAEADEAARKLREEAREKEREAAEKRGDVPPREEAGAMIDHVTGVAATEAAEQREADLKPEGEGEAEDKPKARRRNRAE